MANDEKEEKRRRLGEQYEEINKRNEANAKRAAEAKPTPTQAENDLARLGALDHTDEKEPDGSETEEEVRKRALEPAPPDPGAYVTRDAAAASSSRKRKSEPPDGSAPAPRGDRTG